MDMVTDRTLGHTVQLTYEDINNLITLFFFRDLSFSKILVIDLLKVAFIFQSPELSFAKILVIDLLKFWSIIF